MDVGVKWPRPRGTYQCCRPAGLLLTLTLPRALPYRLAGPDQHGWE